jgi:ATP-dependent Zn protease
MKLVDDCEDVLPLLEDVREDLERVLREHWTAVESLADELIDRKSLSGAEVRQILESAVSE